MSTRSTIAVVLPNGKVHQSYCHWDGYPSHNGRLLQSHYNTQELAEELVNLGDISTLQERMHPTAAFGFGHSFDKPEPGVTVFYGRDRGENGVYARKYDNIEMYRLSGESEEYDYIFKDGEWYLTDGKKFTALSTVLTEEETV